MVEQREYRFVGGPWHGEWHRMDGRLEYYVLIGDNRDIDGQRPDWFGSEDDFSYRGHRCAVYRLAGDYPAERFYEFWRVERL